MKSIRPEALNTGPDTTADAHYNPSNLDIVLPVCKIAFPSPTLDQFNDIHLLDPHCVSGPGHRFQR